MRGAPIVPECGANAGSRSHDMPVCDNCGNDYDKSFQVVKEGKTHTFDSFECAIARLAPVCEHCQVRIIGHGLESKGRFFCCSHCAEHHGVEGLTDRQ
jgi:hypothetical protein